MNSEVYRAILCAQIQSNAADLIEKCFRVEIHNTAKPTHETKEFLKSKKRDILISTSIHFQLIHTKVKQLTLLQLLTW